MPLVPLAEGSAVLNVLMELDAARTTLYPSLSTFPSAAGTYPSLAPPVPQLFSNAEGARTLTPFTEDIH